MMMEYGSGWMSGWGMGHGVFGWLGIVTLLLLIAALIKYLIKG